jgi:hypothetical protein
MSSRSSSSSSSVWASEPSSLTLATRLAGSVGQSHAKPVTQPAKTRASVVKLITAGRVAMMLPSAADGRKSEDRTLVLEATAHGVMWGRPSRAAAVTIDS